MLLLIPVGGINEGGEPIEGARWNYGNNEYELLLYTPDKAEVSPSIREQNGKFLILERRVRGTVTMRCKLGLYDFTAPFPLTIFFDYNSDLVRGVGEHINATHVHGVPTLEWAMNMGKTFLTDWQEENYNDWEFQQSMLVSESFGIEDDFTVFNGGNVNVDLDTSIWNLGESEEDDEDTDDAG